MTEISPDLRNMTIPVGLSARAATVIAKALKQYEDLCPASERPLVEKLQIELGHAVSRVINERERDRPQRLVSPSDPLPHPRREYERVERRPLPKQKSRAEQMAEKMAEAGRAAVDEHKNKEN